MALRKAAPSRTGSETDKKLIHFKVAEKADKKEGSVQNPADVLAAAVSLGDGAVKDITAGMITEAENGQREAASVSAEDKKQGADTGSAAAALLAEEASGQKEGSLFPASALKGHQVFDEKADAGITRKTTRLTRKKDEGSLLTVEDRRTPRS